MTKFIIVSPSEAKQNPYPYVWVDVEGRVRELSLKEKEFLETPFLPGDGGRPAIKSSYDSKNGWGKVSGFCHRNKIPPNIEIQPDLDSSP
ncbi:MAG TPA: hypothetical protein VJ965_03805 [Anaerolineales bacterium]|nr:hypothetical protein [Anaerolineales bacterium]